MAQQPLIALTGATGFIGRRLLAELPRRGFRVRVLLRRPTEIALDCGSAIIGDLARPQNMAAALADVDAVIHSAGIAHAMSGVPADDYRILNTEATIALARAAERARVKRFVFLSSIRAQVGPSAEGVVTETMTARRSLAAVDNLVDAVATVLAAPGPLKRALIVADAQPLSVPEMIAALRAGLGRRPGLIPVPRRALEIALRAAGRPEWIERLAGSLVADASALRALGWSPRIASRDGLAALARSAT